MTSFCVFERKCFDCKKTKDNKKVNGKKIFRSLFVCKDLKLYKILNCGDVDET